MDVKVVRLVLHATQTNILFLRTTKKKNHTRRAAQGNFAINCAWSCITIFYELLYNGRIGVDLGPAEPIDTPSSSRELILHLITRRAVVNPQEDGILPLHSTRVFREARDCAVVCDCHDGCFGACLPNICPKSLRNT